MLSRRTVTTGLAQCRKPRETGAARNSFASRQRDDFASEENGRQRLRACVAEYLHSESKISKARPPVMRAVDRVLYSDLCDAVTCEAIMEKSHSRPLNKRVPPLGEEPFNINVVVRPRSASAKRGQRADKVSREDISRCINIWASMYLVQDDDGDKRDLCLPSRPWHGRNPASLKRFE